jgi:dynein heavy chain
MRKLTTLAGGKNKVTTFLINDGQIKETSFLEDINNLLNTAEIPNLFDPE